MIIFVSKVCDLKIYINGVVVPKLDCANKTGEYSLYGFIENESTLDCNRVNINGINYDLVESKASKFIDRKEIN